MFHAFHRRDELIEQTVQCRLATVRETILAQATKRVPELREAQNMAPRSSSSSPRQASTRPTIWRNRPFGLSFSTDVSPKARVAKRAVHGAIATCQPTGRDLMQFLGDWQGLPPPSRLPSPRRPSPPLGVSRVSYRSCGSPSSGCSAPSASGTASATARHRPDRSQQTP